MVLRLELKEGADKRPSSGTVLANPCTWGEALPHPEEEKIVCIVVGNSNLNWSVHEGRKFHFAPCLFWRTPPINDDDFVDDEPCAVLGRNVPAQLQTEIFGPGSSSQFGTATQAAATRVAASKRIPAKSIYLLSTNPEHEKYMLYLFSDISHRMFRLENTDFFTEEDGCYETFGVDRAACLYSGLKSRSAKAPLLVMDAGTAWTYSALDADGKILGGGIMPGLGARFRSLSDYCGKLPSIGYDEYNRVLAGIDEKKTGPLPAFAKDTKTAIMTGVFQEVSVQCRNIIKQFLDTAVDKDGTSPAAVDGATDTAGTSTEKDASTSGSNTAAGEKEAPPKNGNDSVGAQSKSNKPMVLITGGDAGFLMRCLRMPGHSFPDQPGYRLFSLKDIDLKETKHLNHYGFGRMLDTKYRQRGEISPDEQLRDLIIGQRVAKEFDEDAGDGDNIYRGSIVSVLRGGVLEEDLYSVRYDDGDHEQLTVAELYDALKLYTQVGEKGKVDDATWTTEKREERKVGAAASAQKLVDGIPELQETLRKNAEKENAKAAAAAAAAVAVPVPAPAAPALVPEKAPNNSPPNSGAKRQRKNANPAAEKRTKPVKKAKKHAPKDYLNTRVAKYFELENDQGTLQNVLYTGKVTSYDSESKFWHIVYDDDDEEDYDENDLIAAIKLYSETEKEKATSISVQPQPSIPMAEATIPVAEATIPVVEASQIAA